MSDVLAIFLAVILHDEVEVLVAAARKIDEDGLLRRLTPTHELVQVRGLGVQVMDETAAHGRDGGGLSHAGHIEPDLVRGRD